MQSLRLNVPRLLLIAAGLFPLVQAAAAASNVAWYRLGETDPGAAAGAVVNSNSLALVSGKPLARIGSPTYDNSVATNATAEVGSQLAIHFDGSGSQLLSNANVTTLSDHFAFEVWLKADSLSGTRVIIGNGDLGFSGWGLVQVDDLVGGVFGSQVTFGVPIPGTNEWLHVAVVMDGGQASIYGNGQWGGTLSLAPASGMGPFTVGGRSGFDSFSGSLDEVRVFSFSPGQFSTNDLLYQKQRVTTLPATTLTLDGATMIGKADAIGLATRTWFEWGTNTSYGLSSFPLSYSEGSATVNFSHVLVGLARGTYHYRAVCSNSLGVAFGSDRMFALTNVASGPAGGGQPIALGQPSLELNFIICTNGYYAALGDSVQPPFLGEVRLFAGNFAPAGWLFCHGQVLDFSNHLALLSIIHTAFGGNGSNTFALPDTRSRAVVTAGEPVGQSELILGQRGGATQLVLNAAFPLHTHPLLPSSGPSNTGPAGNLLFPRGNRSPYLAFSSLLYILGNFPGSLPTAYEPFMGQITMFAGDFGFPNAARTEGQLLAINNYTALYSLLRTTFGGNGTTTFALPDLRGRVGLGPGQGPGLTARTFGEQVGAETLVITTNQMPAHQHSLPTMPPVVRLTGVTGSNQPQSLLQPSLAVKFIISTNGEIPSLSVVATNKMIGQIQLYAGTNLPGGWTLCDGQLLNVAAYPALFSVVSNFYGGDGMTTFALPDLRGRMPVGSPTGQPGASYGAEEFVMTEAQLPSHVHSIPPLDFASWCDILGLVGPAAAFDADADGDGTQNGLEWATGTELTNAASFAPLSIAAVGDQAILRFSRNTNATDVSIHLERALDLVNSNAWAGLVTNVAGTWSLPAVVSETGTANPKSVEVSDPLTNQAAADYRLKVTRP